MDLQSFRRKKYEKVCAIHAGRPCRYMANTLKPPSTTATVPVTNFAASLIR